MPTFFSLRKYTDKTNASSAPMAISSTRTSRLMKGKKSIPNTTWRRICCCCFSFLKHMNTIAYRINIKPESNRKNHSNQHHCGEKNTLSIDQETSKYQDSWKKLGCSKSCELILSHSLDFMKNISVEFGLNFQF